MQNQVTQKRTPRTHKSDSNIIGKDRALPQLELKENRKPISMKPVGDK